MPIDVCGFLEISNLEEEDIAQHGAWMACINIGSLMLLTGDECSILFGESKHGHEPETWPPIAKRRGLPANMAYLTTKAVEEALQNDATIMHTWGFTHITYDEIKQIDWQAYPGAELLDLTASYSWGLLVNCCYAAASSANF